MDSSGLEKKGLIAGTRPFAISENQRAIFDYCPSLCFYFNHGDLDCPDYLLILNF